MLFTLRKWELKFLFLWPYKPPPTKKKKKKVDIPKINSPSPLEQSGWMPFLLLCRKASGEKIKTFLLSKSNIADTFTVNHPLSFV